MPRYRNSLNQEEEPGKGITRRTFLALLGLGALATLGHAILTAVGGFLYPNAMKIPPSIFSLGMPKDILASEGRVFLEKQKAFMEVSGGRVRVQTAVCTHLGCTVNKVETGFACPCHGSTYDLDGFNTGGPAPSPLVFFQVFTGAAGDIQVDKSRIIKNPRQAWFKPVV